jgi:hypothetical protein
MPAKAETILHARRLARLGVPAELPAFRPRIRTNAESLVSRLSRVSV